MAAEHVQLLASLAVGQIPTDQLADTVSVQMGGAANKQSPVQETQESDPERVDSDSQHNVPTVIYGNLRKKRKVGIDETSRHSVYKVVPNKERSSSSKIEMRRPVRPIDRQKMRPWLKNLLDKGSVFGLNWMKREEGIFQISWRHASRLGWNLETDGDVFERWARHTGIFKDGDTPEPKRWKANFRCALHSLPDVKELTSPDDRKGRNASRTYRFLTPNEVQPPVKRKHRYSIQLPYLYEHPTSEDSGSQNADSDDRNTDEETVDGQPRQLPHCDHDYAARTSKEKAEAGGLTSSAIFQRHGSGYVLIKSKDAHEFEFRLTASNEAGREGKQASPSQKSSPQSKSPVKRKKSPAPKSALSPVKKGKGKDTPKGGLKQRGGKKLVSKKKKAASEKGGPSRSKPPTVTLQALLAGRQVNRSNAGKRSRAARSPGAAAKKTKSGKTGGSAGKGTGKGDGESGTGTPTQRQGLDACTLLLEAATQLDRMDSLSTSDTSTTTSTKTVASSRHPSKTSATSSRSKQATVSSAPVKTSVAPVPFTATSTLTAPSTVLPMPQASPTMLHQYLGLSAVTSASKTPALSSLLSVASQATTPGVALPTAAQLVPPFKVVGFINSLDPSLGVIGPNLKTDAGPAASSAGPTSTQPPAGPFLEQPVISAGAGTSMLKHLLRLTCPPPQRPPVTLTTAMTAAVNQVSAPLNILPFAAPVMTASAAGDETSKAVAAIVKEERESPPVADQTAQEKQTGMGNFQIVAEYELGSSKEETWAEKAENSFPYLRVSTSKVYVKPEPHETEAQGAEATSSQGGEHTEMAGLSVGEGSSQPATSVDLMQILTLCTANGSNQVVIKAEPPVQGVADDVIAINSAYSPAKMDQGGAQQLSSSLSPTGQIPVLVGSSVPDASGLHGVHVKLENIVDRQSAVTAVHGAEADSSVNQSSENESSESASVNVSMSIPSSSSGEVLLLPKEETTADNLPQNVF